MRRAICFFLGLAILPTTVLAGDGKLADLTDPVEILKKADAAAKAVKAVKYDVAGSGTGTMAHRPGTFQVSIVASGFLQSAPEKYIFDLIGTLGDSAERHHVSGGTDGDMFYVVHHNEKKAYEDIDPAVMGQSANVLWVVQMAEFLYPEPFSDEINAKAHTLLGSQNIGGEDCYEVHVVYQNERAPEATWCFAKKDFLPRRRVDHYAEANGEKGTRIKTVTNLVVNPKLDKDTFKLKLPAGYTKTDDFAPPLVQPPQTGAAEASDSDSDADSDVDSDSDADPDSDAD